MIPEVSSVIKRGNMTDEEYIAMLENEIKKRDKKIDKIEVEDGVDPYYEARFYKYK